MGSKSMSVRSIRLTCWVLFLGPIVFYLVWVLLPRRLHGALVDQSVEASDARFLEDQRNARDPELNGYLSPTFLPVWGVAGTRDSEAEVCKALNQWTDRLDEGVGKPLFHVAMRKLGDAKYDKAHAAFSELVPALRKQAAKPLFVPVYGDAVGYSAALSSPNSMGIRQLARGLAGYASSLIGVGRYPQAMDAYLGALDLASHQSDAATFERALVGMTIWEEATTELAIHLSPETPMPATEWKRLASGLSRRVPSLDQLEIVLQNQIAFDKHSLDLPTFNPLTHSLSDDDVWLVRALRWTGLIAREERISSNIMGTVLKRLERGESFETLPTDVRQPSDSGYFLGKVSWTVTAVSPSYEHYTAALHLLRAKVAGLATVACLMEYERAHKSFPDTLAQMRESGSTEPRDLSWNRSDYKYRKTPQGFVLLMPIPIQVMAQFTQIPGADVINAGSGFASVTVEGYRFRYRTPVGFQE